MAEEVKQEAIDRAVDLMESFAIKLDSLATELGPEVVDLALMTARIDALSQLLPYIIGVVISIGGWFYFIPTIKLSIKYDRLERKTGSQEEGYGDIKEKDALYCLLALISGGVTAFSTAYVILGGALYDPWPWVGLFEPKLWIAKSVLGL